MPNLTGYLTGSRVVMIGTCCVVTDPRNPDVCVDTDPTTVKFIRKVGNTTTQYVNGDPQVVKVATGIWTCTVDVVDSGNTEITEKWRFEADGACHAAAEDTFTVLPSNL